MGFPNPEIQGFAPKVTRGEISATTGMHDDQRMFQVSIPVQPGSSGGPVVDETGSVVGIISSSLSALRLLKTEGALPKNVNYAVKSSYSAAFLDGISGNTSNDSSKPEPKSRKQVIAEVKQAIGLVLVYRSKPQTEPPPLTEQPASEKKPPNQKSANITAKVTDEDMARMNAVNSHNLERLAYSPFSVAVRELGMRGSGRFRIHFAKDGRATHVFVERSTGIKRLDEATQNALLTWRARPGLSFDFVIPMAYTD